MRCSLPRVRHLTVFDYGRREFSNLTFKAEFHSTSVCSRVCHHCIEDVRSGFRALEGLRLRCSVREKAASLTATKSSTVSLRKQGGTYNLTRLCDVRRASRNGSVTGLAWHSNVLDIWPGMMRRKIAKRNASSNSLV